MHFIPRHLLHQLNINAPVALRLNSNVAAKLSPYDVSIDQPLCSILIPDQQLTSLNSKYFTTRKIAIL